MSSVTLNIGSVGEDGSNGSYASLKVMVCDLRIIDCHRDVLHSNVEEQLKWIGECRKFL